MGNLVYEIHLTSGKSFYVKATHELVQKTFYPNGESEPPVRNQYIHFPICNKNGISEEQGNITIYIGSIEAMYHCTE